MDARVQAWASSINGAGVDVDGSFGDQCVDVDLSWGKNLFPGHAWSEVFPPVSSAYQMYDNYNPNFWTRIANDVNDASQIPLPGDVIIFNPTPQRGYTNTFTNPDGHTGVVLSANNSGYTIIEQDGSNPTGKAFVATSPWKYRPTRGWLRPKAVDSPPQPTPTPASGQTVTLPRDVTSWALYRVGSALRKGTSDQIATLSPANIGHDLTYDIVAWVGDYAVVINTTMFGQGAIWTKGTEAIIK